MMNFYECNFYFLLYLEKVKSGNWKLKLKKGFSIVHDLFQLKIIFS